MGLFKSASQVAAINFRRWLKDIRVRFVLLVVGFLMCVYVIPLTACGLAMREKCNACILPFLFGRGNIAVNLPKVLLHIGMILLLCDAPFFSPISPYMLIRSRRDAWWLGACLYIIGAAFLYTLFITVLSVLLLLPVLTFGNEWDGVYKSLAFRRFEPSEALSEALSYSQLIIDVDIIRYLYPYGAQLYVFMASWCSFSFLGLLVYFVSLVKRNILVGMSIAGVFILWDPFAVWFAAGQSRYNWMEILSPVTWTSIDQMDVVNPINVMSMSRAFGLYMLWIAVLIFLIARYSRKIMIELR